ncbi:DUF6314 family protein [Streptomyces sp. NBRC 110611]|uniref:DUF6314 family protein n=1 Tax=Streptomyces sp. NBRC 110611 TaxID=1621259 RepID=UPI00082DDF1A|nr:DUF6314 family protein [Streptomyces sp. NBRC 110611]
MSSSRRGPVPHPNPYPVPDAAAYLTGRWSVERTVSDLRAGVTGGFRGTAEFRPAVAGDAVTGDTVAGAAAAGAPPADALPADALLHVEAGQLTWDGTTYPAQRTLRLCPRRDGTAEVRFADGRPFHDLDLRTGRWTAVHPCAEDRYEGTFTAVAADEWHLEWRVAGPVKDQVLRSVYRRVSPDERQR